MTANGLFRDDIYLSDLADKLDEYSLICISVSDVLLLKLAYDQEEMFEEVGRRIGSKFTPETFRNIRIEAERRARSNAKRKGQRGILLSEIYSQLSLTGIDAERAMELEFTVECEFSYLNPNAYSFIRYCYECGKPVVLVARTRLSTKQMEDILKHAGVDVGYIAQVIVASNLDFAAPDDRLSDKLFSLYPEALLKSILFITDQLSKDLLPSAKDGMAVFVYPVVMETTRGIYAMERDCFSRELGGLAPLRALASASVPEKYRHGDDMLWFQTGCSTMGPIYTLFAEWVVMQAAKTGIKKILCFMRDGELLKELIVRAAVDYGLSLDVSEFFVSRRATGLLREAEVSEKAVLVRASNPKLFISDVFVNLYLDIDRSPFVGLAKKTVAECSVSGELDAVHQYLIGKNVMAEINAKVKAQRRLLCEYIQNATGGDDAITVDTGLYGSTQRSILNALKLENAKQRLLHLLMQGAMQNDYLLLDGGCIIPFITYPGESAILRPPLENKSVLYEWCCSADVGITLRYTRECGRVIPVLEQAAPPCDIVRNKRIFQAGMLAFQEYWFMRGRGDGDALQRFINKKGGLYAIMRRITQMPLSFEARLVGSLLYDGSYGSADREPIAPKISDITIVSGRDIKRFIKTGISEKEWVLWTEGMVENTFPGYFSEVYYEEHIFPRNYTLKAFLDDAKSKSRPVAIYGVSSPALSMARAVWECGLRISCIVDKNRNLQGMEIYGIPVISPEASVGRIGVYIIAPLIHAKEIVEDIEKLHEGRERPEIVLRSEL